MHKKQFDEKRRKQFEANWYFFLTGEKRPEMDKGYEFSMKYLRWTAGLFPGKPRCFECNRPLSGLGSWLSGPIHPSSFHPRLCNQCEQTIRKEEAGAEVELSMLFADVRGSTTLAEMTSTSEFKVLIQRFYQAASGVLVQHNALVNRLMGDQVIGLFVPRFAGSGHARVAVAAALDLLRATGHENRAGPWVPVGIGIHTGLAYVGAVGTKEGVNEIAVLGSAPNLAARLSSQAADGEVILSEAAAASAELATEGTESRHFDLKGIGQPVLVRVLRLGTQPN